MTSQENKEDRRQVAALLKGAGFSLSDLSYVTLDQAIKTLERIRDDFPNKTLELRYEHESYSDYKFFHVYEHRPETDEEMARRQVLEAQQVQRQEERERAELNRLIKKFGPASGK